MMNVLRIAAYQLVSLLILSACGELRLDKINRMVNAHPYIPGKYTCQQYVSDKYKLLHDAGVPDKDIRFMVTDYQNIPHVVLNVKGVILDNTRQDIYMASADLSQGMSPEFWFKVKGLQQ